MEKNLFEIATRNRYRFTYKGVMTVEDLWDLNVEALDAIFKTLNRQKKTADEDSLLAVKSAEEVETYLKDKLEEKYYDQIPAVVDFSGKIDLNYDCLRSIAFELNLGTPFAEAIKDLNIINMNETSYKITVLFKDGYRTSCTKRFDMFNGAQRIYFEIKLKDGFWPDCYINTEDIQYNPANGEQFIDGKKVDMVNPYSKNVEDEKDRYEAFEKDNGVAKVIISRARERDIHYMV